MLRIASGTPPGGAAGRSSEGGSVTEDSFAEVADARLGKRLDQLSAHLMLLQNGVAALAVTSDRMFAQIDQAVAESGLDAPAQERLRAAYAARLEGDPRMVAQINTTLQTVQRAMAELRVLRFQIALRRAAQPGTAEREQRLRVSQYLADVAVGCCRSDPERAARLFGAAEQLREDVPGPVPDWEWAVILRLQPLHRLLGEQALEDAMRAGRALPLEQAIDAALAFIPPEAGA